MFSLNYISAVVEFTHCLKILNYLDCKLDASFKKFRAKQQHPEFSECSVACLAQFAVKQDGEQEKNKAPRAFEKKKR